MRVYVRESWETAEVLVFVYRETSGGREIMRPAPADAEMFTPRYSWEPFDESAYPIVPTYRIPADVWPLLLDEANRKAHGPAIADAVADARATRDRLLAMIERLAT
jgi:hypothetical protein